MIVEHLLVAPFRSSISSLHEIRVPIHETVLRARALITQTQKLVLCWIANTNAKRVNLGALLKLW